LALRLFLGDSSISSQCRSIKLEQAHNDYLDWPRMRHHSGRLSDWFVGMLLGAPENTSFQRAVRRAAALGAVGAMTGVAVHSLVDFGLQVTGIAAVFAILS